MAPQPPNPALQQLLQQDNIQVGSGSTSQDNPQVFTGYRPFRLPAGAYEHGPAGARIGRGQGFDTISNLTGQFYGKWSNAKINSLAQKLAAAGWIQPGDVGNVAAVGAAYEKLLQLTATMNANGRMVTPTDVLNRYLGGGGGAGGAGGRPSSYSETTKEVNLTNPKTARALMIQTLQQRLGRDPSAAEQHGFLAAIHQAEREDPTVRTSNYKLNPATGQYETTSTTTKGGVDEGAFASDFGSKHNQKEYGAYQAATTYFNALMQEVGSPVG